MSTDELPDPPTERAWPSWLVGLALATLQAALYWPVRSQGMYEWDSVQFALGARDFDILHHQPHPPGYPLWVMAVRGVDRVVGDPNSTMILLALGFGCVASTALFRLAAQRVGQVGATVVVAGLVASPLFGLYNTVAATYAVDFAASALIGLLAVRTWEGDKRAAILAAGLLAVFAGLRQSGAVLMGPLFLIALWQGHRRSWRTLAAAAALAGAITAAWLVPTAVDTGGLDALTELNDALVRSYFAQSSVLFGGPAVEHVIMIVNNAVWLPFALLAPLALLLVAYSVRRATGAPTPPPPSGAALRQPAFYALWIGPNLSYVFLLHAPKPGYIALSIPPLVLLIGTAAVREIRAIASHRGQSDAPLLGAGALGVAVLGLASFHAPYERSVDPGPRSVWAALHASSRGSVVESDETLRVLSDLIGVDETSARESLIVTADNRRTGPNQRKLTHHFPLHGVCAINNEVLSVSRDGTVVRLERVRRSIRRVFWIYRAGDEDAEAIEQSLPQTRQVHSDRRLRVFETTVDDDPLALTWRLGGIDIQLYRAFAPRLDRGFDRLERDGTVQWSWMLGPAATLVVPLTTAGRVRVHLVGESLLPDQQLTIRVRGRPMARLIGVRPETPVSFQFQGRPGANEVVLSVDRFNGSPKWKVAEDRRPLAVRFGRIAILALGRTFELVPQPPDTASPFFEPGAPRAAEPYRIGERIDFRGAGAEAYLREGWGGREPEYRWSVAGQAALAFQLTHPGPARLSVFGLTFESQRVSIEINGRAVGDLESPGGELRTYELDIPAGILKDENRVVFRLPDSKSPKSLGLSDDVRQLGIALRSLEVLPE